MGYVFGSFGLSAKEPYTIMHCLSSLVSMSLSSVHTSPWHRVRHGNLIFGIYVHTCPPCMHIKYFVILTCSFWLIWLSTKEPYTIMNELSIVVISIIIGIICTPPPGTGLDVETSYFVNICTYMPHICMSNI